jgi:nucleoside-diphosphate-sugar epimerase
MLNVMITGVYGLIGWAVYKHLAAQRDKYAVCGLARRREPSVRVGAGERVALPEERFRLCDLGSVEAVARALEGMDVVVHLAANPDEFSPWETIYPSNVIGAYHLYEGARLAGVRRIIQASSLMVNWGYREVEPYKAITEGRLADVPIGFPLVTKEMPTHPQDVYSCSKVWAEALARTYSDRYGISALVLRIAWVVAEDRVPEPNEGSIWCSQRDIATLVEAAIHAPEGCKFDIFYGVSNSRYRWVDIEHARRVLGWQPLDWDEEHPYMR